MTAAALKSFPGASANDLIFGTEAQKKGHDKSDGPGDEAEKEIEPKEFFWDQLILYIATIIALLTLLDVALQFLRSGGLFCYVDIPSTAEVNVSEVTRDQAAYINNYCLQDLSISEYYTAFILIQGILLAAPHYLWSSLFRGQFDFFFDLVRQLDRLRDSNTGEYKPANFEIVKKLEKEFPARWKWFRIFSLYIGKLILQLVLAIIFIVVNSAIFPQSAFAFVFECPENFNSTNLPDGWLLPFPVHCVYTSFRVYEKLLIANYFLLVAAIAVTVYGLFWCFRRHTNALGYKDAALFAFTSCLKANEYVYEPFWSRGFKALFSPGIQNDLDFILMRLYRADSGHGQVFKEIQVDKELKQYISRDHELLHLYVDSSKDQEITERLHPKSDADGQGDEDSSTDDENDSGTSTLFWASLPCMDSNCVGKTTKPNKNSGPDARPQARLRGRSSARDKDLRTSFYEAGFNQDPEQDAFNLLKGRLGSMKLERVDSIRNLLFGFFHFAPDNNMAHDISFGTIGYSLILSRAFRHVVSVNFNPFYRNETEVRKKDEFHTNYVTITFQDDIFSQKRGNLTKSDEALDDEFRGDPPEYKTKQAEFIIVGPFTDESKKATVNLHIERMKTGEYFHPDAVLLAIRPLKIGDMDVSERFCRYRPPKELFKKHRDARKEMEVKLKDKYALVKHFKGIRVTCNKTDCIFEFAVYKFKGKYPSPPVPPHEQQRMLDEQQQSLQEGQINAPGIPPPGFPPAAYPILGPFPHGAPPFPPGLPPFGPPLFGPFEPQKQGSIALVFPVDMLPQLSTTDIEQFLSGTSNIQLSAKPGSGVPIRFVFRGSEKEDRSSRSETRPDRPPPATTPNNDALELDENGRAQRQPQPVSGGDPARAPEIRPVQPPPVPPNNDALEQDENRRAQQQPQPTSGSDPAGVPNGRQLRVKAEVHPEAQSEPPTVVVHNGHYNSHNHLNGDVS